MVCDLCGAEGVHIRRVSETLGKGPDLLVVENVPRMVCPQCGESYFTVVWCH